MASVRGGRGPGAGRRERASSACEGETPGAGRLGPGAPLVPRPHPAPGAWPPATERRDGAPPFLGRPRQNLPLPGLHGVNNSSRSGD